MHSRHLINVYSVVHLVQVQDVNPAGGDNEDEELLDMDMEDVPGLSSSSSGAPIRLRLTRIQIRLSRKNGYDLIQSTLHFVLTIKSQYKSPTGSGSATLSVPLCRKLLKLLRQRYN